MKIDPIKFTPAGLLAMLRAELGVEELEAEAPSEPAADKPEKESEGDHVRDL